MYDKYILKYIFTNINFFKEINQDIEIKEIKY